VIPACVGRPEEGKNASPNPLQCPAEWQKPIFLEPWKIAKVALWFLEADDTLLAASSQGSFDPLGCQL